MNIIDYIVSSFSPIQDDNWNNEYEVLETGIFTYTVMLYL